jgi:SAM-dependent methyltransferase
LKFDHGSSDLVPPLKPRELMDYFSRTSQDWEAYYTDRSLHSFNYRARATAAVRLLGVAAQRMGPGRLLDVGCGAGGPAQAAADAGWEVVGADLSLDMVQRAAARTGRGLWVVASADALPFRPGAFDAVVMLGVLEYLGDAPDVLRALHTAVRRGGHLVVSAWMNRRCLLDTWSDIVSAVPDRLYLALKRALTGRGAAPPPADGRAFMTDHSHRRSEAEVVACLRRGGWTPECGRATFYGRFRFMGKQVWPARVDEWLSAALTQAARLPGAGALRRRAMTLVVLAGDGGSEDSRGPTV